MNQSNNFDNLTNEGLEDVATSLRNNAQTAQAIQAYGVLAKRFEVANDLGRAANMQHMIGVSYKIANKTAEALAALADARYLYEQIGDRIGVGRALRDEGLAYAYSRNYDLAQKSLQQSVDVLDQENDPAELGISQVKLGGVYLAQDDAASAEQWINQGLQTLITQTDHWFYIATARMHLAELHIRSQQYDEALLEVEKANKAFLDHDGKKTNIRRLAEIEAMKALVYKRQGHATKTQQHADYCRQLLGQLDSESAKYLLDRPELREVFGDR